MENVPEEFEQGHAKKARLTIGKDDPVAFLNEQCLEHILSFVGAISKHCRCISKQDESHDSTSEEDATSDDEETVEDEETNASSTESGTGGDGGGADNHCCSRCGKEISDDAGSSIGVLQAFKFYQQIASVSRGWRKVMDQVVARLVIVDLDFQEFPEDMEQVFVEWCCHHKLRIENLKCGVNDDQRFTPLATQILVECDVSQLEYAVVRISLTKTALFLAQRKFHDLLAKSCPKLEYLNVGVDIGGENQVDGAVGQPLFSFPGIHTMGIKVFVSEGTAAIQNGRFLCGLMQNLPKLRNLHLDCDEELLVDTDDEMLTVHVTSQSLKNLRVEDFCVHAKVVLNCPSLCTFTLGGGLFPAPFPNLAFFSRQKVEQEGTTVPESCLGLLCLMPRMPPFPFPFRVLLGDD